MHDLTKTYFSVIQKIPFLLIYKLNFLSESGNYIIKKHNDKNIRIYIYIYIYMSIMID